MPLPDPSSVLPAQIAQNLARVRTRVDDAARAAGRAPSDVRLLVATKTQPADAVRAVVEAGADLVGENRVQELVAKAPDLADLVAAGRVEVHMIGHLQRNKARHVARWAATVDSVDSERLVDALERAGASAREAGERDGPLGVLLQVSLDGDPGRGGVVREALPALADRVAAAEHLRLDGLMTVLPRETEPAAGFADAADLAERLRHDHPAATAFSAGMSGDLEAAVAHGSTCVRVGTALLGSRPLAFLSE